jgi:NADPH:quinone reductase-like Zn-dependent oxidoreductase
MGLHVAAVDVDDRKLDLARRVGAVVSVNARDTDPVTYLKQEIGGAHSVLVTAASPKAFEQALGMVRRGGTIVLNGLPPGSFALPIIDMVLGGITLRGSIVRNQAGPPGRVGLRRRRRGESDGSNGTARGHQRRVRPNARGTDRGARRARLWQLTRRYAWQPVNLRRYLLSAPNRPQRYSAAARSSRPEAERIVS